MKGGFWRGFIPDNRGFSGQRSVKTRGCPGFGVFSGTKVRGQLINPSTFVFPISRRPEADAGELEGEGPLDHQGPKGPRRDNASRKGWHYLASWSLQDLNLRPADYESAATDQLS